jgi:hypothetical protein
MACTVKITEGAIFDDFDDDDKGVISVYNS